MVEFEGVLLWLFAIAIGLMVIFRKNKTQVNNKSTSPVKDMLLLTPAVILLLLLFFSFLLNCGFNGGLFCSQFSDLMGNFDKINKFFGFPYALPFILMIIVLLMYVLVKFLKKIAKKVIQKNNELKIKNKFF